MTLDVGREDWVGSSLESGEEVDSGEGPLS